MKSYWPANYKRLGKREDVSELLNKNTPDGKGFYYKELFDENNKLRLGVPSWVLNNGVSQDAPNISDVNDVNMSESQILEGEPSHQGSNMEGTGDTAINQNTVVTGGPNTLGVNTAERLGNPITRNRDILPNPSQAEQTNSHIERTNPDLLQYAPSNSGVNIGESQILEGEQPQDSNLVRTGDAAIDTSLDESERLGAEQSWQGPNSGTTADTAIDISSDESELLGENTSNVTEGGEPARKKRKTTK